MLDCCTAYHHVIVNIFFGGPPSQKAGLKIKFTKAAILECKLSVRQQSHFHYCRDTTVQSLLKMVQKIYVTYNEVRAGVHNQESCDVSQKLSRDHLEDVLTFHDVNRCTSCVKSALSAS